MDYIREALDKSNAALDKSARPPSSGRSESAPPTVMGASEVLTTTKPPWVPPAVQLNQKRLEKNRIVSFSMSDPSHVPFNLLRTRVRAAMSKNSWTTLGITSPTPGCGKTVVALNLAVSLVRGGDIKTVLIDLDLKRPAVARTLGISSKSTVGDVLQGRGEAGDCLVQVAPNFVVALNKSVGNESSELLQSVHLTKLLDFVHSALSPDLILFDLPPMGIGDDVLSMLPMLDAALLVIAAGHTTAAQADECEQQISANGHFLGLVLNKSESINKQNYNY